jgi:hypothetical protein
MSESRLELAIAIGLGIAAVLTALFVVIIDNHDDKAQVAFNEGVAEITESTGGYVQAAQLKASDEALFADYATNAYAATLGDRFSRDIASYLLTGLMREQLRTAVVAWSKQQQQLPEGQAPISPFVEEDNPDYPQPELTAATDKAAAAQDSFAAAQDEQNAGDKYLISGVIVATALFLFGIAGVFKAHALRLRLTAMGYVVLVGSLVVAVL